MVEKVDKYIKGNASIHLRRYFNMKNNSNRRKHFRDTLLIREMQRGLDEWVKGLRSIKETPETRSEGVVPHSETSDHS